MQGRSSSPICVVVTALLIASVPLLRPAAAFSPLFNTRIDYQVGPDASSVAIGDFNEDGHADLAVANFNYSDVHNVSVLLGNDDGTFQASADYEVGGTPSSVAIGDLNGDGHLDMAVSNQLTNNVSVLLGVGDGSFQPAVNYEAGTLPSYVAIGDLNGDGRPDMIVANEEQCTERYGCATGSISVFLGNGDGTFQAAVDYATGIQPVSVAIGDLNGDGHPDVAVANVGSCSYPYYCDTGKVSVFFGNGDGTFHPPATYDAGNTPYSVAIGDMNMDGKLDLIVANWDSNTVAVLLGNGDGTFQPAVNSGAGAGSVTMGDLNGDGHPDLAVANLYTSTVSVLFGDGDGTFRAAVNYGVGYLPHSVAIGDLNGDGHPDLAVADYVGSQGPGYVSVLLGNGDGTFRDAVNYGAGSGSDFVAIGDLNGDGHPDLAVANNGTWGNNYTDSNVSVFLGRGDSTFQGAVNYAVGGPQPQSVAIGDLNGDGHADLAVANGGNSNASPAIPGNLSVFFGNGDGTFQAAVNHSAGTAPNFIALGDLNGDGRLDLAVVNWGSSPYYQDSSVSVLLGNGDGTFQSAVNYGVGRAPRSLAIGDLNGDGRPDLAAANYYDNAVSVLLGNGDGTFQSAVNYAAGSNPKSVAIGDLNGDGHPDLAVASEGGDNVSVLLGNGDGTFQTAVDYGVGHSPRSVAIGDLNGDGTPDLGVANYYGDNVSVLLGNGDGTFQAPVNYGVGVRPWSLAIGDLNADGKPDLAVANWDGNNISVLTNLGALACTSPPGSLTLSSPPNGAAGVSTAPVLSWGVGYGVTSYEVAVCTDSGCSSVVGTSNQAGTEWTVQPALSQNTAYFWHSRAVNSCGFGPWSNTWAFTTALCTIPGSPGLSNPSNGGTDVSTTPLLTWGPVSDALSYDVQVCSDSFCSSVVRSVVVLTSTQWSVSPALNKGTTYFWRARAHNVCGLSVWSDIWSFTTCVFPSATPSLSSPSNGATNISTTPLLIWGDVSGATSYDVQICGESVCSSVLRYSTGLTSAQWTVAPALSGSTTYAWRARVNNACGPGQWSSIWSFTTGTSCFIATAAFGTPEQGKIDVLRSFRDAYLLKAPLGEAFVTAYYRHSPPAADYIAQRPWLRAVARTLLLPLIGFVSLFV